MRAPLGHAEKPDHLCWVLSLGVAAESFVHLSLARCNVAHQSDDPHCDQSQRRQRQNRCRVHGSPPFSLASRETLFSELNARPKQATYLSIGGLLGADRSARVAAQPDHKWIRRRGVTAKPLIHLIPAPGGDHQALCRSGNRGQLLKYPNHDDLHADREARGFGTRKAPRRDERYSRPDVGPSSPVVNP